MVKSGLEPRRFFNTSGKAYREGGLKDLVKTMTREEIAHRISQDGMLLKRPLLIRGDRVVVGFSEEDYSNLE